MEQPRELTPEEIAEDQRRTKAIREMVARVRDGAELTPADAENLCRAEHGIEMVQPFPVDRTRDAIWPLRLAQALYAWRDVAVARVQHDRFEFWGDHLYRDAIAESQFCSLQDAEAMMTRDLQSGVLRSFGGIDGRFRPVDPGQWWSRTLKPASIGVNAVHQEDGSIISAITVLRHEVVPLLLCEISNGGVEPRPRAEAPDERAPKNKGGAPPQYAWDDMWIEVCRIIHAEGLTGLQPHLRKRMQDWFATRGFDIPGDRTMSPKFTRLFDALNEKG